MEEIIIRGLVCAIQAGKVEAVKAALISCQNRYTRFPHIYNVKQFYECCLYVASQSNCKSLVEFVLSNRYVVFSIL